MLCVSLTCNLFPAIKIFYQIFVLSCRYFVRPLQLFESLRLSCGLLVALPVIGGLFLVVGVALIVVAVKKGSSVTTA